MNVTFTSGHPVSYGLTVQDGSREEQFVSAPLTHTYKQPGQYVTTVTATDVESNSVLTTKLLQVIILKSMSHNMVN